MAIEESTIQPQQLRRAVQSLNHRIEVLDGKLDRLSDVLELQLKQE